MWVLRMKVIHNCVIGNRCRKFHCWAHSLPFGTWTEKGYIHTSHIHTIEGDIKKVNQFISDLKKDKELVHFERFGQTVFLVQKRKTKDVIIAHYNNTLFMVKPFFTNDKGEEFAEYCSWNKENLMKCLESMKKTKGMKIVVEKFHKTKLGDIYITNPLPRLSARQRQAFQLAVKEKYYKYPRNLELQELAKIMKVSTSTYQEHLRKAEEKILQTKL